MIKQICPFSSTLKSCRLSSCAIHDPLTSEIRALLLVCSGPHTLRGRDLWALGSSHRVGSSFAPVPIGSLNGLHRTSSVTSGCVTGDRQ